MMLAGTETVVRTFVRKYTNARIGGYVAGGVQRNAESKGQRVKGGGNLREKLTHITNATAVTKTRGTKKSGNGKENAKFKSKASTKRTKNKAPPPKKKCGQQDKTWNRAPETNTENTRQPTIIEPIN